MIRPGEILLLDLPLVDPPHDKFVLVLAISPKAYFAFINSRITDFAQARPALRKAQVVIDAASHKFLNYDSYLDCADTFYQGETDLQRIYKQLETEPSRHKGSCSPAVLRRALSALNEAPTVSKHVFNAALESLTPLLNDE